MLVVLAFLFLTNIGQISLAAPSGEGPATRAAFRLTGILPGDPISLRARKILALLADRNYLGEGARAGSSDDGYNSYLLDSERTPEQVLAQRIGGGCGSFAMAMAALLEASGVPESRLRLVGAFTNRAYSEICSRAGEERARDPRTSGDGHVFVMIQLDDGRWRIVDTTTPAAEMESAPIASPEKLEAEMKNGPVRVPDASYQYLLHVPELSDTFGTGLTVFQVWKPSEYPRHDWRGRLNLIASGSIGNRVCRYDASRVMGYRPIVLGSRPHVASSRRAGVGH